jgi:hypothetical protein
VETLEVSMRLEEGHGRQNRSQRLGIVQADGALVHLSPWLVPLDGARWCATSRDAHIVNLLCRELRCAFGVAANLPPYRDVPGQVLTSLDANKGAQVLERLLHLYTCHVNKIGPYPARARSQ